MGRCRPWRRRRAARSTYGPTYRGLVRASPMTVHTALYGTRTQLAALAFALHQSNAPHFTHERARAHEPARPWDAPGGVSLPLCDLNAGEATDRDDADRRCGGGDGGGGSAAAEEEDPLIGPATTAAAAAALRLSLMDAKAAAAAVAVDGARARAEGEGEWRAAAAAALLESGAGAQLADAAAAVRGEKAPRALDEGKARALETGEVARAAAAALGLGPASEGAAGGSRTDGPVATATAAPQPREAAVTATPGGVPAAAANPEDAAAVTAPQDPAHPQLVAPAAPQAGAAPPALSCTAAGCRGVVRV
jgi:hypothetical protein